MFPSSRNAGRTRMTNKVDLEIRGTRWQFPEFPGPLPSATGAAPLFCFLPTKASLPARPNPCTCAPLVLDDQRHAWAKHPLRFVVHESRRRPSSSPLTRKLPTSALLLPIGPFRRPRKELGSYPAVSADITGDADSRELQGNHSSAFPATNCPTFAVKCSSRTTLFIFGARPLI